jgi:hypothetical protein
MKLNVIRYSMIFLLIGSVALGAGRADERHKEWIEIESFPWGIALGQTARVSVAQFVFLDGSVRMVNPTIARIQLLDAEGEIVAQSDEIRVEPGKTRFWDAPYEQISGVREPTGRIQLRARVLFEKRSFDRDHPPLVTLEIFDSATGATKGPLLTIGSATGRHIE